MKGFKQPATAATATCESCGPGRCGLAQQVLRALAVNPTFVAREHNSRAKDATLHTRSFSLGSAVLYCLKSGFSVTSPG